MDQREQYKNENWETKATPISSGYDPMSQQEQREKYIEANWSQTAKGVRCSFMRRGPAGFDIPDVDGVEGNRTRDTNMKYIRNLLSKR